MEPDLILFHGKITTLDAAKPEAAALAVTNGEISAIWGRRRCAPTCWTQTPSKWTYVAASHSGTQRLALARDPRRPFLQP